jgi:hypothetical protein
MTGVEQLEVAEHASAKAVGAIGRGSVIVARRGWRRLRSVPANGTNGAMSETDERYANGARTRIPISIDSDADTRSCRSAYTVTLSVMSGDIEAFYEGLDGKAPHCT